ncbi:GcrA family cell cycle regulator [Bradyrhizobium sp. ISRA443]|uniref:GcrA family cell cycle regulator n=1 Tax=unclassified Bradyrhizobium TaxID=2631580 RepID=UPI002478A393|nr:MULTISPECIES: GcrA family cell cycle regulator [unclassified Bradyrhizobium]WGR93144.1 GcrA family cell cycle regulator [Bradyrhizobium sp. ISRA435]WGR97654.1 GcrA family cell cycle regulator [Bradyrhizobium sp. ISRA436]WGS04544.1 GcrA family cell cycle regulator [Bradyrhizobium sp. ISRA437]WGS11425.1 GcrA family cell cycle regulator [Bradyrhizobium sp. ISRA443]
MEMTNWLPEHSAALRDLRARGMSYSEIADAINERFHTAYTRNAALSRGQRMGLGGLERLEPSLPNRVGRPESTVPVLPRIEVSREVRREAMADMVRWPKPFSGEGEAPKLRCVEITPRHLSLVELERGDCRYPYGGDRDDEPITFCGHPRRPGSSYCTPHFHLSRDPELSAEPVLSAAWLRVVGAT